MHDPRTDEPFLAALTTAADEHADGVLAGVDVLLASTRTTGASWRRPSR